MSIHTHLYTNRCEYLLNFFLVIISPPLIHRTINNRGMNINSRLPIFKIQYFDCLIRTHEPFCLQDFYQPLEIFPNSCQTPGTLFLVLLFSFSFPHRYHRYCSECFYFPHSFIGTLRREVVTVIFTDMTLDEWRSSAQCQLHNTCTDTNSAMNNTLPSYASSFTKLKWSPTTR